MVDIQHKTTGLKEVLVHRTCFRYTPSFVDRTEMNMGCENVLQLV